MNCETLISVTSILGSTIHTREAAHVLMDHFKLVPSTEIRLDFSNVEFISRSFADEFHISKMDYIEKFNVKVIVYNANEDVINMLQAVTKTQNVLDRKYDTVQFYNYSNIKHLETFFLAF